MTENKKPKINWKSLIYYVSVTLAGLMLALFVVSVIYIDAHAYEATSTYSVYDNTDISRESITSTLVTYSGAYQGGSQGNNTVWYIIFKLPQGDFSHQRLYLLIDGDVYAVETGIISDGTYQYVRFAPTANISGLNTIGISFGGSTSDGVNSFEFAEIVLTNRTNDSSALTYVEYTIQQLNAVSTDFVVSFDSYSTNDTTYEINQIGINTGVTYNERIYLTSNQYGCYLTLNGMVAMNGGITQYSAYVSGDIAFDPVALDNLSTTDNSRWATNFIADNNLDITDYGTKAQFNATFNLTDRVGDTVAIYITATNPYEQTETIVMCLMVYVDHSHPEETDTETDTDSPIESDTDTPDIPVEPPEHDSPELQDAYNKGYQEAIIQMQNGIFGNVRVVCKYYYYSVELGDVITDEVNISLSNFGRGLSFEQLYTHYVNSEYYNENFDLYYIFVNIEFPAGFRFNNNLLYFTGNDTLTIDDMPTNILIYTIDEYEENHSVTLTKKYNDFYWNVVNPDEYQRVQMLSFRIDDLQKSFYDLLVTDNLTLASNTIQYTTDISSWQDGKNAGYDEGYADALDKGIEIGKEEGSRQFYDDGYDKGYSDGERLGYINGKSDGLKENFNWYEIPISIYDGMAHTFRQLFAFEVFGVNIASFIMSVMTMLISVFILKKVF